MGRALALPQPLAEAVIALMYAGGQSLEAYASGRASRAMTAPIARQPRTAMREDGGVLAQVPLAALVPGDRIMVRVGDVVPVEHASQEHTAIDAAQVGAGMEGRGEPAPGPHENPARLVFSEHAEPSMRFVFRECCHTPSATGYDCPDPGPFYDLGVSIRESPKC
ncbi:hypothetical protein SB2_09840 [Methylobacterium radiotolerans]|nr:hypothetical protein SB3_20125 [Methylobacterium radiotolerans]KTS48726.1 hypothetical protein SB2_09840 [Methylobacterium radiotolerans]GEN01839.1 hypothetical protein MRA01_63780 [Methylobacterium radiotolerans]